MFFCAINLQLWVKGQEYQHVRIAQIKPLTRGNPACRLFPFFVPVNFAQVWLSARLPCIC